MRDIHRITLGFCWALIVAGELRFTALLIAHGNWGTRGPFLLDAVYFMVMFVCLGLVIVIALIRGLPVGRYFTIVVSLVLVAAKLFRPGGYGVGGYPFMWAEVPFMVFPGRVGDVVAVALAAYGIWVVLCRFPPPQHIPVGSGWHVAILASFWLLRAGAQLLHAALAVKFWAGRGDEWLIAGAATALLMIFGCLGVVNAVALLVRWPPGRTLTVVLSLVLIAAKLLAIVTRGGIAAGLLLWANVPDAVLPGITAVVLPVLFGIYGLWAARTQWQSGSAQAIHVE